MSTRASRLTRRRFITTAAVVPATALAVDAPDTRAFPAADPPRAGLAIDVLGLDAATRADLEAFAQPVLRETRWLDELPLDGVRPAFAFAPGEEWP